MTARQKLEMRLSEIRTGLAELAGAEGDWSEEQRSQAAALRTEMTGAEQKLQAAIASEPPVEQRTVEGDGEARELAELRSRVSLGRYMAAGVGGLAVSGAEREFNQLRELGDDRVPLELLAPAEVRAETDADAARVPVRWIDRLFAESAAMYIGISMESVATGAATFPVMTAGATGAQRGREQAASAAAWTVGVTNLQPTRNSVRADFTIEDAARLPGLEDALARDLRMAISDAVDKAIFVGDAGANEASADIVGLSGLTITEKTLTQANKIKGPETLAEFAELIDGVHAATPEQLRMISSVGANTLWMATNISGANAEPRTLASYLRGAGLDWRVRGDIESNTANGDFGAFVGRQRGIDGAGVAAIWDSMVITRDPYSDAAGGGVRVVMSYLWDFALPRAANFARLKFVT